MPKTTIQISGCYALHIDVRPVPSTGDVHICIASTFSSAKDPQGQHVLFAATINRSACLQLAKAIEKGTNHETIEGR